jgi:hypothetical protein
MIVDTVIGRRSMTVTHCPLEVAEQDTLVSLWTIAGEE